MRLAEKREWMALPYDPAPAIEVPEYRNVLWLSPQRQKLHSRSENRGRYTDFYCIQQFGSPGLPHIPKTG